MSASHGSARSSAATLPASSPNPASDMRMKKLTEGRKMFVTVMATFAVYAATFILFDDFDRQRFQLLDEASDWHLLVFSLVVMGILAVVLHHYTRRMDERISREQAEQQAATRRQLTQNIAHELKTPVASIQGYLETLLAHPDISNEQRRQFLDRSLAQTTRLAALLRDITTLQRMDDAPDVHAFEALDVAAIVANVMKETALQLTTRHMTFANRLPATVPLQGNPTLLYGVFRNLTDNAIAYAGEGTTITLTATETLHHWHFTFRDNGVGIAPEHLPRLFERFYRVDKGRSRKLGGTGLGLAIVKNTVLLHGGTITVSADHGLRFDFSLHK
ncbi:MAG: hypothetical protein IJ700_02265 [Bacteroidaceae bacterium]|nr:hypothetical protein [Bacteroidaceae bacterium]